jgi:CheY-like chemotaxis protein
MTSEQPVLIVDDEPQIRAFTRMALEDEGYGVLEASDGATALDVLRAAVDGVERLGTPGVILLDLQMPGMDGRSFLDAYLGTDGPRVPVVVLTASRVPLDAAEVLGAVGVLRKPFTVDALLEVIERYCSPRS